MKKLADISAFESIQPQSNATADVSVFNFTTNFAVDLSTGTEEARALLSSLGAVQARFVADIRNASELDRVLRFTGCEGYRQISSFPEFDTNVFYDCIRTFYEDSDETTPIDEYVDGLYNQPYGGLMEMLRLGEYAEEE